MNLHKFTISSKIEFFNGERKVKHTVIKVELEPNYIGLLKQNLFEKLLKYE